MDKFLIATNILAAIGFILIVIAVILTKLAINKYERKIANQEAMIKNRDKLIEDFQKRNNMASESNAILRNECLEQEELLKKIANTSVIFLIGREKEALKLIRELTRDYRSEN